MILKQVLSSTVENWGQLAHPAIMERFVLRKGKSYQWRPRVGPAGTPKECFSNAAHFVLDNKGATYVEGYFISPKLPIAIHHAWVTFDDTDAMDLTIEREGAEYYGVAFDTPTLRAELLKNKVYGLFDCGRGINTDLLFKLDPELKAIADKVINSRRITA